MRPLKIGDKTFDLDKQTVVMGILNVTPDSFSDDGRHFSVDDAVSHAISMVKDGADIIDIGGESTRPGAATVSLKEETNRVIPVIEQLINTINVPLSIDTYKAKIAQKALDAGVNMVNDITALSDDSMAKLAAKKEVPVVLMHMQGTPATMQAEPKYEDVVNEVSDFLVGRAKQAEQFGIPRNRVFIDPGIGFGKTLEHNLLLLKNIDKFVATGYRVLVGTSRKSFIGKLTGKEKTADRIYGTAATVALCVAAGVSIVRVHDVAEMVDVVKVANALWSLKSIKSSGQLKW